ncbi:MAG: ankyrin repeat domain-containing protein [Gemmatimonadaceae bacterium]|nr:ankyrin repeat domain-containing protein [Gemmatimonadaceae bacterium]
MDRRETTAFWRQAWMSDHERPLTPAEEEFVDASVRHTSDRWNGECDVERMADLVERHPSLLETIGPAVLNIAAYRGGCGPALEFLLDRGLVFSVAEHRAKGGKESEYDIVHEAAWALSTDNLRILLERGMADPRSTSNPHTGWPDNVSLLYWAAVQGGDEGDGEALTRLLLEHGADPEVKFKGNGERGCTALQEACVHGQGSRDGIVQALIDHGARYDAFSASARDDLDRLRQCAREEPGVARSLGEAEMTPLHWASRAGALRCARWLLNHGADVDAQTVAGRTPLHMAGSEMLWLLAAEGADLNAQDRKGRTPLHQAMYGGDLEEAEILIVLGADVRVPNRQGKTPLEVARKDCLFFKRG